MCACWPVVEPFVKYCDSTYWKATSPRRSWKITSHQKYVEKKQIISQLSWQLFAKGRRNSFTVFHQNHGISNNSRIPIYLSAPVTLSSPTCLWISDPKCFWRRSRLVLFHSIFVLLSRWSKGGQLPPFIAGFAPPAAIICSNYVNKHNRESQ